MFDRDILGLVVETNSNWFTSCQIDPYTCCVLARSFWQQVANLLLWMLHFGWIISFKYFSRALECFRELQDTAECFKEPCRQNTSKKLIKSGGNDTATWRKRYSDMFRNGSLRPISSVLVKFLLGNIPPTKHFGYNRSITLPLFYWVTKLNTF